MLSEAQRARMAGQVKLPGTTMRLLGAPSKMPGFSWSLPAGPACPYIVKDKGSICTGCYARKGHYVMGPPKHVLAKRFQWVRECLKTDEGTDLFVKTMVDGIRTLVDKSGEPYFRIHDSGDFFYPKYVRAWYRVCEALPDVLFWAPTRSYQARWADELVRLNSLPNVTVRPSALYFDDAPPVIDGLAAGTGASKVIHTCPAHAQDNECKDCRVCWTQKETEVMYRTH